jgi:hypothetical protein
MNTKTRIGLIAVAILLSSVAPHVRAQASLVQIQVDKKQKLDRTESPEGEAKNFVQLKETLSYNIEIKNISSIDLPKVVIKWTVLYQPFGYVRLETHGRGWSSSTSSGGSINTAKGEVTCSLGPGRKHEFDTDAIELGTLITNSPERSRDYHGKAVGYLVEVFAEDKLVGSKAVPSDIKRRIKSD